MRRSRMRSRLSTVALTVCAAATCGCACLRVPRIDPTGERVFAEPPIAATPQYRPEPGPQLPGDDVAVMLSPHVTVAPVGSEVVLVAGVRGPDGYLRTNRRLEWSLAPGGVGHFVAVGKNGPVDLLLGDFNRPRIIDNTFAVGSTSRKYLHLNRGTPTTSDDVCVLRGQGWITLSSPIEGTSHVVVYAPEVYAWDSRTRTATIHWVDAQWRFPPPAINPTGTTHVLTTTVMRHTDQCPCEGWQVRYEIVDGPAAGFAPDGAPTVEVATDAAGQASVEIFQKEPGPGTNRINVQVIRPAALGGSQGRRLVVGSGTTMKTWTSPDLAVRKTGPAVAGLGATLTYRIEVSNPGDLPAEDLVVTDELPEALTYLDSNPAAEVNFRKLQWRLGRLGAGESRTLELGARATQLGSVTNSAHATAAGGLEASDSATTTVMAPSVDVKITGPTQATVGSEVTFEILITNRSQAPATGLLIKDRFDPGLEHAEAESPIERDLGDLASGESQRIEVTFRVTQAGRLGHTVEVSGAEGVRASAEAYLTAVEGAGQPPTQPIERPSVTIKKSIVGEDDSPIAADTKPQSRSVGETVHFTIDVTNTGTQPLTNLTVADRCDPSLEPFKATEGFKYEGNDLVCRIASLPAGRTTRLEVRCNCRRAAARAWNRATVTTQEGAQAEDEAWLEIRAAVAGEAVNRATAGDLTLVVADLDDPVAAGKELRYRVWVSNDGQTPDTGVTVEATIPIGMTLDRLRTTGPEQIRYEVDGRIVRFEPVAEILPGKTLEYRILVRSRLPGKPTFRVKLTSENLDQPLTVEESTDVVE